MQQSSDGTSHAGAVCLIQSVIAVASAGIFAAASGKPQAWAALYGGIVALLPTAYFARRVFRRRPGQTPADLAGAVYRGEIGKIALTALLFVFGISVFAKHFLALILTFMACQLAYWVAIARIVITESHRSD